VELNSVMDLKVLEAQQRCAICGSCLTFDHLCGTDFPQTSLLTAQERAELFWDEA